jgi:hypothetical protein
MQEDFVGRQSLRDLDDLARAEYGGTFAEALEGQPEDIFVRRLARLSGIPLKQPFSFPCKADGESLTGARQYWELKNGIKEEVGSFVGPYPLLAQLREQKDPAYQLVEEMAKVRHNTNSPTLNEVADTINNAQYESNWFTNLVLVIRPRLCSPGKQNEVVIEGIKKAADDIANKSVEYVLTAIIEPLSALIVKAIPFLHFVPHMAVLGATFFIVKFAGHSFCNIEIVPQFQLLFGGNNLYESK